MTRKLSLVAAVIVALTLSGASSLCMAQIVGPATPPAAATAPAATKPAITPEQRAFNEAARNTPPDKPFPKEIDTRPLLPDGSPNPDVGKVSGSFKNYHETFLKRRAQPMTVLFIGDSITAGWNSTGSAVWKERYAKLNAANFGISGDKTQHVLWRIDNGELDGIEPKVVVLMIGTNNSGDTAPAIASGVVAIAKKINEKLPKSKLLLLGIFPRSPSATGPDGKPTPVRAKLMEVNAELAKLHDGKTTFYLEIWKQFLAEDGSITKEMMADALHPGPKGYQVWADAMQPTLDELLK
jgi:lysophospholipase L1-like esterase